MLVSNAALQWVPGPPRPAPRPRGAGRARWLAGLPGAGQLRRAEPHHPPRAGCRGAVRRAHGVAWPPRTRTTQRRTSHALRGLGCEVDAWETTYLHVLDGEDPVFTWVSGTGARPTLQALPDELRPGFEEELRRRLREAYPRAATVPWCCRSGGCSSWRGSGPAAVTRARHEGRAGRRRESPHAAVVLDPRRRRTPSFPPSSRAACGATTRCTASRSAVRWPAASSAPRLTPAGPTCGRRATPWTCSEPPGCSRAWSVRRWSVRAGGSASSTRSWSRAASRWPERADCSCSRASRRRERCGSRTTLFEPPPLDLAAVSDEPRVPLFSSEQLGWSTSFAEHQNGERKMTWQTGMPVVPDERPSPFVAVASIADAASMVTNWGSQRRRADQHRHHPDPGPAPGQPRGRPRRHRPGQLRRHRRRHGRCLRPPGPGRQRRGLLDRERQAHRRLRRPRLQATTRGSAAPEWPDDVIRSGRPGSRLV